LIYQTIVYKKGDIMPSIEKILEKKKFKKKAFRPWNDSGEIRESSIENAKNTEKIIDIDTKKVIRWAYKNRPQDELYDIDILARKIKANGQQEPCIVRICESNVNKYELITGERRWRAAIFLAIPLKVVIRNLTDLEASITQKEENDKSPVSDYANGICYAKQIHDGIITRKNLIDQLNISKQQVSRLLSYAEIPGIITTAIGDMKYISAGTAEKIKQISKKGEPYKKALIQLSKEISSGKLGHATLQKAVDNLLEKKEKVSSEEKKIHNKKGVYLFSWKNKKGGNARIMFSKKLSSLLDNDKKNVQLLLNAISGVLEDDLNDI